jgi:TonB family protein
MYRLGVLLLCLAFTACADIDSDAPIPSPQTVQMRCVARITRPDSSPPSLETLNRPDWNRYVGCSLSSNLVVKHDDVLDNPEATVTIKFDPPGIVASVALTQSSGNPAWDRTVNRAIAAVTPLPPAHALVGVSRIEMHFVPGGQLVKGISRPVLLPLQTCMGTRGRMFCR